MKKYPPPGGWKLVQQEMTPQEFLKHWDVSPKDLVEICQVSYNTVKCWFTEGKTHRECDRTYKQKLAATHREWSVASKHPNYLTMVGMQKSTH